MQTAVLLQEKDDFAREMGRYLEKLKKEQVECEETAYEEAKAALIRTGVITKNGKNKKKIVTWE